MKIYFKGNTYAFRDCDVKGMTEANVIARADKYGELQTEVQGLKVITWLFVPGIGFAWPVD